MGAAVDEVAAGCISTGVGEASTTLGALAIPGPKNRMPTTANSAKPTMPPTVPPTTAAVLSLPPLEGGFVGDDGGTDGGGGGGGGDDGASMTTVTTLSETAGTETTGAPMKVLAADLCGRWGR